MMNNQFPQTQQVQNGIDPLEAIQQFAGRIGNPQRLVRMFYSDVPAQYQNDPDRIADYLISIGKVSRQQIDYIRQYAAQKGLK